MFNWYLSLVLELVHYSRHQNPIPFISAPQTQLPFPLASTTNLLSVSMDSPILDISCKRDHTICGLLGLASLAERRVFKACPHCRTLFLFMAESCSISWLDCILFIRLPVAEHVGFRLSAPVSHAAVSPGCTDVFESVVQLLSGVHTEAVWPRHVASLCFAF